MSKPRCVSALSSKRRDTVVHKICISIASRLGSSEGIELSREEMNTLFQMVSELYARTTAATPSAASLRSSPLRPLSAASSSFSVQPSIVTQRQIDHLVEEFLRTRNAKGAATVNPKNSGDGGNTIAPTQFNVAASKPPRPVPLRPHDLIDLPDHSQHEELHHGTLSSSSPIASSPFSLSGSPLLNRSMSSLKSTTNVILSQIGDTPPPSSKRLRKMIRDSEEYQRALDLANAEKADKEAKRRNRAQSCEAFRTLLDTQCQNRQLARQDETQRQIEERRQIESEVEEFKRSERHALVERRERLAKQKILNEAMRMDTEVARLQEKKIQDEEDAREIEEHRAAAEEEKKRLAERRVCQTNALSEQLKLLADTRRQESLDRIQELRQSKLQQLRVAAQLEEEERRRVAKQKELAQRNIYIGEQQRAARQREQLAGHLSADEKKEAWLKAKYIKEFEEEELATQSRQKKDSARRSASKEVTQYFLAQQIANNEKGKDAERREGLKWAADIQSGIEAQQAREALQKMIAKEEKREWVHLLDAQSAYKKFQEMQDITTSIPRAATSCSGSILPSPARSDHASPSLRGRPMTPSSLRFITPPV